MRKEPISHRSFVRNSKRFQKVAEKEIQTWFSCPAVKERLEPFFIYALRMSIEKLVKTHKSKPFKRKSAFTNRTTSFSKSDDLIKDIRVSYELSEEQLVFKVLTRTKSRFKRKVKFVINI